LLPDAQIQIAPIIQITVEEELQSAKDGYITKTSCLTWEEGRQEPQLTGLTIVLAIRQKIAGGQQHSSRQEISEIQSCSHISTRR
jgi:hypothetical protein